MKSRISDDLKSFQEYNLNYSKNNGVDYLIRLALLSDVKQITFLILNYSLEGEIHSFNSLFKRTRLEIIGLTATKNYKLFVAVINNQIIGFSRYIYYSKKSIENYPYRSISGFYLMGVIVSSNYRKLGIGVALTKRRIMEIINILAQDSLSHYEGGQNIYYMANTQNKVSIEMHKKLGFVMIDSANGFLKVNFQGGLGHLFCKKINE